MADRTPAQEIQAAAAKLDITLPGDWELIPRVVMGDGETDSALAWCADHTNWNGGPAPEQPDALACWNCDTAEMISEPLARMVRDLLAARRALAKWLESWDGVEISPDGAWVDDAHDALVISRAINGSTP
jgi:hypothetical protein